MWRVLASVAVLGWIGSPASACIAAGGLQLGDILAADVVVVGRIYDFRPAPFSIWRSPSQHRRFAIEVREVLRGEAPHHLVATWRDPNFGMPDRLLMSGPYLVALRWPTSPDPDGRLASAPEPDVLTVLQSICDPPFFLRADGEGAQAIRTVLAWPSETPAALDAWALATGVNMNEGTIEKQSDW